MLRFAKVCKGCVTKSWERSLIGLFAAAHTDDDEMFRQLVAAGTNVTARDSQGRTPAHVAAFASEDEALRALAEAGADMNALDGQASDLVTIAAVPSVSRVARW